MVNIIDSRGNQFTVPDTVADDYREPGTAVRATADDPTPDERTHNGDIRSWAERHGVDLGTATTKADMLDVIRQATDG